MDFKRTLELYKEKVEESLFQFFHEEMLNMELLNDRSIEAILSIFTGNGGKRVRPISFIKAYESIKDYDGKDVDTKELERKKVIDASCSVELYHNSTLVHDDIFDEDLLRRNEPTVVARVREEFLRNNSEREYDSEFFKNKSSLYAVSKTVCAGCVEMADSYLALLKNFEFFKSNNVIKAVQLLAEGQRTVNLGQIQDIELEYDGSPSEEKYYEMTKRKTGQLFVTSLQMGAVLAGASEEQLEALTNYAWNAATTFQLQDDIMDISPKNNKGHERGSDIKQGKITLLYLKAFERANNVQEHLLGYAHGNPDATKEDIEKAIDVIYETGAVDYTLDLARSKIKESKDYLNNADLREEGIEFFKGFADYMLNRDI